MKIIGIIIIFLNLAFFSKDEILPKNEAGLVYFEEEVSVENIGKEALYNNALQFIATVKKENKKKSDVAVKHENKIIEKKGSFFVYTQGLITPQIHGEISYKIRIQVNDGSYKYTFSDFVFQYYQRNRHGRYAPVSGKTKGLEDEKFAGMQRIWVEHKENTKAHVENQIKFLKSKMSDLPPGAKTAQNKEEQTHYND